ncbi:hypothetical protein [Streptomyces sp. ISL-11]|uniref:hypothetical protein n=1 Tax=Streptomyces sp. ISL-11 TaxID=2819174 RepID=UPI001BEA2F73|nr:hypothetical protein [Streptomyces sp. ISL-11]MBT2384486.1 hypothetical protein [Streptomyces sp. ISL-11]
MSSQQPVPADLAREARDLVEQVNHAVLDAPEALTAPRIHETTRALMQLVERLPQTFEQLADVLELRAREGAIRMDTAEDPDAAARAAAEDLRAAAAEAHQLARHLTQPAGALFSMAHHD